MTYANFFEKKCEMSAILEIGRSFDFIKSQVKLRYESQNNPYNCKNGDKITAFF